jgi:hypothetical protein
MARRRRRPTRVSSAWAMSQRDHDRSRATSHGRAQSSLPRRTSSPILALQGAIGNRATTHVLARKGSAKGTFEHSVQIGKLGPIEITDSNIDAIVRTKDGASDLIVTTVKGKHSQELKRLSEGKSKIDTIAVSSITGQNSWMIVTFGHALIRGYEEDPSGKTEHWKAVGFDTLGIKRTSIGMPRP